MNRLSVSTTLSARLVFPVFYLCCAIPLTLSVTSVMAADALPVLPAITVTADGDQLLDTPVAVGSHLDITPFQTPASVDVITRKQLEQRGDANLQDAIVRAPGMSSLTHPGNGGSALSVRGFTDSASVMQLYDGTRQYGGVGVTFPFDTWSIDRIEVLRGPASVIYGEGAIGGVVNVIPKKPRRGVIINDIEATIGTDNTQRFGFDSSGSINDLLSYRFDISGNRSDGWVDMGESRNVTISGAVQLRVSPDFSLQLSYAQGKQRPMRYFGVPLVNGQPLDALREKNYNVGDSMIKYDDRWTELSGEWTPNADTTVHSKLYYIHSKRHWYDAEDYQFNSGTGLIERSANTDIVHDQSQVGMTTDATFRGQMLGLKNQVSLGLDMNFSTFRHSNNLYTGSSPDVDPYNPVPGSFISAYPTLPRYRNKARQYSVFSEDRLELNERWSVLAGLRYDHADVSRQDLVTNSSSFDKSFSNIGWRIGSVCDLFPGTALYGQYSTAADPVSGLLMLSPANSNFSLSTGKQVEVGIKQEFWNRKAQWTLAVYQIKKNNLVTRDVENPALSVQVGQRSSKGIEGTLSMALAKDWQLDANAAILRARYDDFSESVGGVAVSRAGNVPTDVPERVANVWVSWHFLPAWTVSSGMRYVGKRFADNANTLKMPAYTTTDMGLQWQAARDTTVSLHGFNVFDKHYFSTAYYNQTQWLYGPGRRVELTVKHAF